MIRFIHIKKNGGTSVYKFLRKNGVDFVCGNNEDKFNIINQHTKARVYSEEPTWKFCVVRNPYSRVVSFFNWCKRLPKYKNISFNDFVEQQYNIGRVNGCWDLQTEYMFNNQQQNIIDKVFKFETMPIDIPQYFNIQAKFPCLNVSTTDQYENYYNDKLQEIVYTKLKFDFEYLGYDKCLI